MRTDNMTKNITYPNRWKPGESGNPRGRPRRGSALTELLRLKGEQSIVIGGEEKPAKEALAEAVWQFVMSGEVWLAGKRLSANSVGEWASVVKWLYSQVEPPRMIEGDDEPELVVRVVREDVNLITAETPQTQIIEQEERD
jgi:hypothetical protein